MRLSSPFIKLPLRFDAARLAKEALQFSEDDWTYHPLRHNGNTALPLVSVGGTANDRFTGEMRPTAALSKCPYVRQVMSSFQTVIGRSRFMRLAAGADVPSHSDGNYSWRRRLRIHIPVSTHPDIIFSSVGNIDVHMAEGEAWTFDNWRQHAVYNRSNVDRIHLVIDTVGTSQFWDIVEAGWDPRTPIENWSDTVNYRPHAPTDGDPDLLFEQSVAVSVRPPDEVENMLGELLDDLGNFETASPVLFEQAATEIERFTQDWRSYWSLYGNSADSVSHYELLAKRLKKRLEPLLKSATFDSNDANAYEIAAAWISSTTDSTLSELRKESGAGAAGMSLEDYVREFGAPAFRQPVFIVAAPRSGSTMLFEALQKNKDFWTIGDESQREVESISALHPMNRDFESNELSADDYTPQVGALLMDAFMSRLQNAAGSGYLQTPDEYKPSSIRFLEKTPKNSLRIPFFRQMFPDARFIYLHREPEANMGSMIDAWQSQKFVTYKDLPGWDGPGWSLLLPPGWRSMRGRPLSETVAWQWAETNKRIMQALSQLPRVDWIRVSYESLLDEPGETLKSICEFAEVPYGPKMQAIAAEGFAVSKYTLTPPKKDKWKRHEADIVAAAPLYSAVRKTIANF